MTIPSTTTAVIRTLDQLLPGQTALVRQIGGRGDFRRRLMDMGLTPGSTIKMLQVTPMGDPIEYLVDGARLTLRRADARVIVVDFL